MAMVVLAPRALIVLVTAVFCLQVDATVNPLTKKRFEIRGYPTIFLCVAPLLWCIRWSGMTDGSGVFVQLQER